MGVPCIVSDGDYEAESVCSTMTVEKITVATLTEDTDCVIFGDGQMLDPVLIRKELSFTKEQFTDLSILMGCDFSGTLQKVGHVTGVKLIKEHKNIEAILALNKYKHGPDFNYVEAREVFKNTFKIPEVWRDENFWEHLESKKNSTLLQKFLVEHNVKNNGLEMSYMLESFLEDSDG
ncbi:hypothetical protein HK099_006534 [Clydaea vesicula]|uniref:XPG-I domain-containing protein n=1 Tax=Clydaea vesicula TaxID=447962 RepID=A0AAD5U7T8_9FUNG|nr:hypothetical protein HK099_006534 [Clydaea vesicula]